MHNYIQVSRSLAESLVFVSDRFVLHLIIPSCKAQMLFFQW